MNGLILIYQVLIGIGLSLIAGLTVYSYFTIWRKDAKGAVAAA